MRAKIQKWGNSLALRIPKAFADETGLDKDTPVEIRLVDGQIQITLIPETEYQLDALLEAVTTDNLHGEVDTGDAIGNEVC